MRTSPDREARRATRPDSQFARRTSSTPQYTNYGDNNAAGDDARCGRKMVAEEQPRTLRPRSAITKADDIVCAVHIGRRDEERRDAVLLRRRGALGIHPRRTCQPVSTW